MCVFGWIRFVQLAFSKRWILLKTHNVHKAHSKSTKRCVEHMLHLNTNTNLLSCRHEHSVYRQDAWRNHVLVAPFWCGPQAPLGSKERKARIWALVQNLYYFWDAGPNFALHAPSFAHQRHVQLFAQQFEVAFHMVFRVPGCHGNNFPPIFILHINMIWDHQSIPDFEQEIHPSTHLQYSHSVSRW